MTKLSLKILYCTHHTRIVVSILIVVQYYADSLWLAMTGYGWTLYSYACIYAFIYKLTGIKIYS